MNTVTYAGEVPTELQCVLDITSSVETIFYPLACLFFIYQLYKHVRYEDKWAESFLGILVFCCLILGIIVSGSAFILHLILLSN